MEDMTTSPATADRYGAQETPARRRRNVLWMVAAGVVLVAVVVWLALGNRSTTVSYETYGYKVVSAEEVRVTVDVTVKPGTLVSCTIDALNEAHAQVGTHDFTLGPSTTQATRYTVTLHTSERAVTGTVDACRVVD